MSEANCWVDIVHEHKVHKNVKKENGKEYL
jgi:hypothetical protein